MNGNCLVIVDSSRPLTDFRRIQGENTSRLSELGMTYSCRKDPDSGQTATLQGMKVSQLTDKLNYPL